MKKTKYTLFFCSSPQFEVCNIDRKCLNLRKVVDLHIFNTTFWHGQFIVFKYFVQNTNQNVEKSWKYRMYTDLYSRCCVKIMLVISQLHRLGNVEKIDSGEREIHPNTLQVIKITVTQLYISHDDYCTTFGLYISHDDY